MKFRVVIFDLDGTLLNTLEDLSDATNCVLRKFDYPQHEPQAYKFFVGDGLRAVITAKDS